ncbi:MAG: glycoside hydrolase family 16 protein [Verrucomicrobiae bacterium]|nr:glycoside hydrolase family 16 protein [Verrucomicrobiae bacterium]
MATVAAAASIEFTTVPAFRTFGDLTGRVAGITHTDHRIAVYIRVAGGWWTKPTFQKPLTPISPNLTWVCDITTGGNDHMATDIAAFLLRTNYTPPLARGELLLPATLFSNAVAIVKTNRLIFRFSGHDWTIKESAGNHVGPGPNIFSSNASNVWLDAQGRLHLRITRTNNQWHCAEVVSMRSFGHGTYRFYLDTPLQNLDPNAVLGLFTWSDDPSHAHREIDVELSHWSNPADTNNAQFVVQPWHSVGHRQRFRIPPNLTQTTHTFKWSPNEIVFQTHQGPLLDPPATNPVLHHWTFKRPGIPPPGDENVRINLWLHNGTAPTSRQPVEVIISRFVFIPATVQRPCITSTSTTGPNTTASKSPKNYN